MGHKLTTRSRSRLFPVRCRCAPNCGDLMSFSGAAYRNCLQIANKLWNSTNCDLHEAVAEMEKGGGGRGNERKSCRKPCIGLKATRGSLGHVLQNHNILGMLFCPAIQLHWPWAAILVFKLHSLAAWNSDWCTLDKYSIIQCWLASRTEVAAGKDLHCEKRVVTNASKYNAREVNFP